MATHFKADGTRVEVKPKDGKKFTLAEMQKFVGGWIEVSRSGPTIDKGVLIFVMNEEGLAYSLPVNEEASSLYGARLVGDVLVIFNEKESSV